jgi:hypothetical protein
VRPQNWPRLLDEHLQRAKRTAFAYGSFDCVTFVCDWHKLMTGADVYGPWRGRYDSKLGADRLIVETGARSFLELGGVLFGKDKWLPKAGRGDIACNGKAFGLHLGRAVAYLGPHGLSFLPPISMRMAWSV